MSEEHTHHPNYVKIWAILIVLLAISVAGPMIGIKWVTLLTAFVIATVKADRTIFSPSAQRSGARKM